MFGLTKRRLGLSEARSSLTTLWNAVSGIAPRETMDLITQSAAAVNAQIDSKPRFDETAVFANDQGMLGLVRRAGCRVTASMFKVGQAAGGEIYTAPETENHPQLWASNKFTQICERLGGALSRVV